ncbi:hypothetical protein NP493_551g03037 [Ridgeia piscesae]|uniref:Secreted protein n=1 Tax=Ridgeia piscesae TaxID=27915 RepID=A0AAD9KVF1_RIDPI|nr:hypothetical protein NP493_551g03037 [Ridgeia piscesae]
MDVMREALVMFWLVFVFEFAIEGLRLKNPVSCSPGSSHPMTNSGSICSTGEESTLLLLYLQNHHPHATTSTNSVCFTRSIKSADINCPEQSRHIRSRTSPLLQQSSHHVKWLLPLAHQKMTKEAVTVSDCLVFLANAARRRVRSSLTYTVGPSPLSRKRRLARMIT